MKNIYAIGLLLISFGLLVGCSSQDDSGNVPVMKPTDPGYAPPGVKSSNVGAAGGPAPSGGATQGPSTE